MNKTLAALAATATLTATMTLAASPASASHDPEKCQSLGTFIYGDDTLETRLCELGKGGRLRVRQVEADTVPEVLRVKELTMDSVRQVQPAVYCGHDGEGYLLELAAIHGDETGVRRLSRAERLRFATWAERYISKDTTCTLVGPL